jgi:hypothetical protein
MFPLIISLRMGNSHIYSNKKSPGKTNRSSTFNNTAIRSSNSSPKPLRTCTNQTFSASPWSGSTKKSMSPKTISTSSRNHSLMQPMRHCTLHCFLHYCKIKI